MSYLYFIAVVPQPVYMNMSDLANMAVPSGSDGSSSGYGSQNAVREEDQGFADGKLIFILNV